MYVTSSARPFLDSLQNQANEQKKRGNEKKKQKRQKDEESKRANENLSQTQISPSLPSNEFIPIRTAQS
jgi:hypothetical protein